ncbi:MAG: hypothetical protein Q9209_007717 [Squamulea sp. 1 TL-2023]
MANLDLLKRNLAPSFTTYRDIIEDLSSTESEDNKKMPGIIQFPPLPAQIRNNTVLPTKSTKLISPPLPALSPPARPQQAEDTNANVGPAKPSNLPLPLSVDKSPKQRTGINIHHYAELLQTPPQAQHHIPPINNYLQQPFPRKTTPLRLTHPSIRLAPLSEQDISKNENDMTMNRILDEILIPQYLSNSPSCTDSGLQCKRRYIHLMKFRHLKLISRVERWRMHIPYRLEDEQLKRERTSKNHELDRSLWNVGRSLQGQREGKVDVLAGADSEV